MVAVVVGADMCDYYWKLRVGLMREVPTLRTACAFNWSPVRVYMSKAPEMRKGGSPGSASPQ